MPNTVTHEVAVENIRKGDVISTENYGNWPYGATVARVDVKVKWVTVYGGTDDKLARVELGTKVKVDRQEPTDSERYAANRMESLQNVQFLIGQRARRQTVHQYMAEVAEAGKTVGYDTVNNIITMQAEDVLWIRFENVVTRIKKIGGDELTALALYIHNLQDRRDYRNPLSRSTSVVSNVMEDTEHYVTAEFIASFTRYNGVMQDILKSELSIGETLLELHPQN